MSRPTAGAAARATKEGRVEVGPSRGPLRWRRLALLNSHDAVDRAVSEGGIEQHGLHDVAPPGELQAQELDQLPGSDRWRDSSGRLPRARAREL